MATMRTLHVYWNKIPAGTLTEENRNSYVFRYHDSYLLNAQLPAISVTMPKQQQVYRSDTMFPVFFNMLSEGVNRKLQGRLLHIDEQDFFGLLAATAQTDTIGAITVKPTNDERIA